MGGSVETFGEVQDFFSFFKGPNGLLVAAVMTLVVAFVFKKRHELGRHAIENTATSVVVYGINVVATVLFSQEINAFAQRIYSSLGIPTLPADFWGDTPIIFSMIVLLVAMDFCNYFIHRVMHTKWGWPSHAAHHTDTHVNAFTTFRIHYFEAVLMVLNYMVLLTWMQLPELLPILAVFAVAHNMYVHLDLPFTHGPLKYLIASPVFHRWHHADVPEAYGKNLANLIPLYDVIFGTYYVPGPCTEKLGAMSAGLEDKNPVQIWIYPFQAWARLIRDAVGKIAMRRGRSAAYQKDLPPAE